MSTRVSAEDAMPGPPKRTAWVLVGVAALLMLLAQPASAQDKVTLYITNAQGSVVATMTPQGQVTYAVAYRPYGRATESTTPQSGPGYTGHVTDTVSGLVYMQQRYYQPGWGRFISPDPVAPTPGNIFNFGRYTYANDNPIRYTDPDGRKVLIKENPNAPHAGKHSIKHIVIKTLSSSEVGTRLLVALEGSSKVWVITPKSRPGTDTEPNNNSAGRVGPKGKPSAGTGGTIKIYLGTEKVKISNTPGKAGSPKKVSNVEKLVHEMDHANKFSNGTEPAKTAVDQQTGNTKAEQSAMNAENQYRAQQGLKGRRYVY